MIYFRGASKNEEIRKILSKKGARVYFVGIGGISMSALALLLARRGVRVSGSDVRKSEITDMLRSHGVLVRHTHAKEHIMSLRPDLAVFSLALDGSNPEYKAAIDMNVPTVSRAELLGALLEDYETSTGVSGSHGKSTVTAMLGKILTDANKSPTILCGADISGGSGLVLGGEEHLVYESCEYGDSFLKLRADVQLLLNLELDHTDYFKSEDALCESFLKCANNAGRCCILNYDSENLRSIASEIKTELHTVSQRFDTEYRYRVRRVEGASYSFDLFRKDEFIGEYHPRLRGEFNAVNSVLSAVGADVLGIPYEVSSGSIASFVGIKRRLELIERIEGVDVFYDYAHHPSEIRAVRLALSEMGYKNTSVIFAPHTYSRTASFFDSFVKELAEFHTVYVTDVYGARESAVVGISSTAVASAIRGIGGRAHSVSPTEAKRVVSEMLEKGPDSVVLMGAGDVEEFKKEFINIRG